METFNSQQLANLLSKSPLGHIVLDDQLRILYVNESCIKITGYNREDLLLEGFFLNFVKNHDYITRIKDKAKSAFTEIFDDLDVNLQRGDGEKRSYHLSGFPWEESGKTYACLMLQDITDKKAYEKVIESSFDNFVDITLKLDEAMRTIQEQKAQLEEYQVKMKRELQIATGVQRAIIPKIFPKIPGFDMYGTSIPSEELGGDYFDYFLLDNENKKIGILIADVSGHGVPSSLITTMVKAYFEYYTKRYTEPDQVLQHVNRDIAAIIMDTGFYLTAFYAVLDLENLTIKVASAGHDSAICSVQGEEKTYRFGGEGADGTILGIFQDAEYQSIEYPIKRGSKVIIYTDGITEARADSGEFFGSERLENFIASCHGLSSRETGEKLIETVDAFYGTNKPNDDRTFVVFDVLPEGATNFDAQQSLRQAKKYMLEKNFRLAYSEFLHFLEWEPKNVDVLLLAGQAASHLGEFRNAIKHLVAVSQLDPQNIKAYYYLGLAYFNDKNFAEAQRSWETVLELNPNYRDTKKLLEKLKR